LAFVIDFVGSEVVILMVEGLAFMGGFIGFGFFLVLLNYALSIFSILIFGSRFILFLLTELFFSIQCL
jgi:hypothetical protein